VLDVDEPLCVTAAAAMTGDIGVQTTPEYPPDLLIGEAASPVSVQQKNSVCFGAGATQPATIRAIAAGANTLFATSGKRLSISVNILFYQVFT
jgi:hypothetical protein